MSTSAKATGFLELNITGFDQALKTAKNLMVAFAAGFSAYKIADFFKDGIKGAIDFGKEMQSASRAMGGFDPGALLLGQKALEKMGMGAEEARGHISDFISQGRKVSEIFGGSENYARALKSAAQDYGSQASVLTRSGEKLQSVWNTMESIGSKVKTFFLTATEQFVLPLQAALDYLNQIDLAGVGAEFGAAISKATTILLGLFKNGDLIETLKVGLTLAMQEGVNYLIGGINYVAGITQSMVGKALLKAVESFGKAWDFLFSGDTMEKIGKGFIGICAKFTAKLMEGINSVVKVLGAGMAMTIQAAVEKIPGLSKLIGDGGGHRTFDEMYKDTGNLISPEFINGIKNAGQGLTDGIGGAVKKFADQMFKGDSEKGFKKGTLFDTDETGKKFQELLEKGLKTGTAMEAEARGKHSADEKGARQALTSFSGSSSRVIADSLAKVGGGGNFLRVGMSLQERTQMQIARASKETAEATKIIASNTKPGPAKSPTLGRGQ